MPAKVIPISCSAKCRQHDKPTSPERTITKSCSSLGKIYYM